MHGVVNSYSAFTIPYEGTGSDDRASGSAAELAISG